MLVTRARVWRAKRNKNQSATLRALPRNIATWTPQYYAIDVATSSASDPVILRGLRQRGVRRSRNIAGCSLCRKAHAHVKSAKFTGGSLIWLKLNYCSRDSSYLILSAFLEYGTVIDHPPSQINCSFGPEDDSRPISYLATTWLLSV